MFGSAFPLKKKKKSTISTILAVALSLTKEKIKLNWKGDTGITGSLFLYLWWLTHFQVINWAGWCHKLIKSFSRAFFFYVCHIHTDTWQFLMYFLRKDWRLLTQLCVHIQFSQLMRHCPTWSKTWMISSQKGNLCHLKQRSLETTGNGRQLSPTRIWLAKMRLVHFHLLAWLNIKIILRICLFFSFFLKFLWEVFNNSCTRVEEMEAW